MRNIGKPKLEVCLSPALLHLYDTNNAVVVIIDVFRATSTITTALHNGAECVIPTATVAECIDLGHKLGNSITAGERDGKVAEGLQFGNSPLDFPPSFVSGKTLILTTTNGTRLLHMIRGAAEIVIGSFLNLTVLCDYIKATGRNVLLGCASWKDRVNMEDTLFAGAIVRRVQGSFSVNCDSALMAAHLFDIAQQEPLINFLRDSSHYQRLAAFGLEEDMAYCVTTDLHPVVPVLRGDKIVGFSS